MHFDQRTQAALRELGLSNAEIREASKVVSESVDRDAETIEAFFAHDGDTETFYSDMDMAHSASDVQEHAVRYVDLYTHGAEIRGYLRFDSWGVPVEGGRVLDDDTVELSLGGTVNDRVRFVRDRSRL
jgi:hypothetical protein